MTATADPVLTLNERRFTRLPRDPRAVAQMADSCDGFYRPWGKAIHLFDRAGTRVGGITDGKLHLSVPCLGGGCMHWPGTPPGIGTFPSHAKELADVAAAIAALAASQRRQRAKTAEGA